MSTKTTKPVTVTNRLAPCNCGCKGSDPWHQRSYTRVVSNIEQVAFEPNAGYAVANIVTQSGTVKMPWGDASVVFVCPSFDGKMFTGDWRITR